MAQHLQRQRMENYTQWFISLINHTNTNNLIPIQENTEVCTIYHMYSNPNKFIVTTHKFSVMQVMKYIFKSQTTYRKATLNRFQL